MIGGGRPGVEQVLGRVQYIGIDVIGGFVETQHVRFGQ